MVQAAHEAGDWASDEYVGYNGAYHSYDQELTDMERPQDPHLINGVEHDGDEEYSPDVFVAGLHLRDTQLGITECDCQLSLFPTK